MNLKNIDEDLFKICKDIFNPKFINPINQDEEKQKFFSNENYNPLFENLPKNKHLENYKKKLKINLKNLGNSNLDVLFRNKIIRLSDWIDALENVGTKEFTNFSLKLYGKPSKLLIKKAESLVKLKSEKENKPISSEKMVNILNRKLKKFKGWKSVEKENLGSRIDNIVLEKTLYVKKGEYFSKKDVDRLIIHEIGVHSVRAINGIGQKYKLFFYGTADYEETEEGLAVYMEEKNKVIDNSVLKNYAGRVLAIHYALNYSFRETFKKLQKYFSDDDAYHLTMRVKRGLKDTSKSGAFTKDLIYLKGYLKVKKYLENNPLALENLFQGKVGIEDLKFLN